MRALALASGFVVVAVALLLRPEQPPRATIPADTVWFVHDDWLRLPEAKVAAAFAGTACAVSYGAGELDGDAGTDSVVAYPAEAGCAGAKHVAIRLGTGETFRHPIAAEVDAKTGSTCPGGCTVFALSDLNDDGRAEVLLMLSHGASVLQLGAYRLGPNGLARLGLVRHGRREPAAFSYYGSVCCGAHVVCRGPDRVVAVGYGLGSFAGTLFVSETVYRFDGRTFVPISSHSSTGGDPYPGVGRYPGRDCIEPPPLPNPEADLDRLLRGEQ